MAQIPLQALAEEFMLFSIFICILSEVHFPSLGQCRAQYWQTEGVSHELSEQEHSSAVQVIARGLYRSPAKASELILTLLISGSCYEVYGLEFSPLYLKFILDTSL